MAALCMRDSNDAEEDKQEAVNIFLVMHNFQS